MRYQPSVEERTAIDLLTTAGYKVVRQRTYADLLERARMAEAMLGWETERRESVEQWAHRSLDESDRLGRRLNEVCFTAAALGVSIQDINSALEKS